MNKQVVGVYDSEEKVIEAVEELQLKGHRPEEIILVSGDSETTSWLRDHTLVKTEKLADEDEKSVPDEEPEEELSFIEKVKTAFKGKTEFKGDTTANSIKDPFQFTDYGIPENHAEQYQKDVADGKIVVLSPVVASTAVPADAGEIDPDRPSQTGDPMSAEDPVEYKEEAPQYSQDTDVKPENRDR
ncbi:general stress protein [Salisediminibacterium halotolerans]|uniref:general stress protein n=1 Tax=Salisediminibacterium halotolerans TaxID=517425 RepID=UPI000EAFED49|nr:general stress protein [Salisediminibacterium halotolerans]RLJ73125.1 heat induced stress protein YflT [Actinophytocola xinjiangensis]RPE86547.1 heat induced stress protein YflT [Salisediminibacterium halotolerans]TWG33922.1 heat induced stress protein YflT [Salisediminibacterium halotolerans]GEL08679.1 hypothetical protein SHA02_20950 [Salisediminibacterium halotolerans]